MKQLKQALISSSLLMVLAVFVNAQDPSIFSVSKTDKFSSSVGAFSISLPSVPTETKPGGMTTDLVWRFKEGMVVITYGDYLEAQFKSSPATHKAFLDGYKGDFMKYKHLKFISEVPYSVGTYRGMAYTLEIPAQRLRLRDVQLTSGRKYFSITGSAKIDVPGAEAAILKAVNSLRFSK